MLFTKPLAEGHFSVFFSFLVMDKTSLMPMCENEVYSFVFCKHLGVGLVGHIGEIPLSL